MLIVAAFLITCICMYVYRLGLNVKEVFHRLVRVLLQKYTLTSALLSESPRRSNLTPMTAGFIFLNFFFF